MQQPPGTLPGRLNPAAQPSVKSARQAYGSLRVDLERRGEKIGPHDMLIAAQALSLGATLVTNDEREFRRVKGLRVENWVQ